MFFSLLNYHYCANIRNVTPFAKIFGEVVKYVFDKNPVFSVQSPLAVFLHKKTAQFLEQFLLFSFLYFLFTH